jgi:N-acetylmuramoyl-L-alanine amidase
MKGGNVKRSMTAMALGLLGAAFFAIPVAASAAPAQPAGDENITVPLPAPVITAATFTPDGKRCNAKSCGDVERQKKQDSKRDGQAQKQPRQEQPKQEQPQQEQPQQDESDRHTVFVDPAIGVCVNCLLADISL